METVANSTESNSESGYPPAWRFGEEGDIVEAAFVRFTTGPTKDYGRKPIVVLNIDGAERSVWLLHDVLFQAFRRELQTRPSKTLEQDESISIRLLGKKQNEEKTRSYTDYRTTFHDSPEESTESIFGLDDEQEGGPEPSSESAQDDGVPF